MQSGFHLYLLTSVLRYVLKLQFISASAFEILLRPCCNSGSGSFLNFQSLVSCYMYSGKITTTAIRLRFCLSLLRRYNRVLHEDDEPFSYADLVRADVGRVVVCGHYKRADAHYLSQLAKRNAL